MTGAMSVKAVPALIIALGVMGGMLHSGIENIYIIGIVTALVFMVIGALFGAFDDILNDDETVTE